MFGAIAVLHSQVDQDGESYEPAIRSSITRRIVLLIYPLVAANGMPSRRASLEGFPRNKTSAARQKVIVHFIDA
ncbi:hypothetical protein FXV83_41655 [Bradyrhizobium hipponense]|uniref:Uncharacterized protein n=1 Tax=Bradyrhizobium hipponense TaxID=2605638 RepID=A0A5S4YA05_9BRAD|nr:hypothetical protein [Bradyrhizobium hipponense]TYO60822.1 hypothetical protein FXV83_41655 [Bradyrhizobium hipponense]